MSAHVLIKASVVFDGRKVIENGFVEIADGRIVRVGASADLTDDLGAEVVDAEGHTVLPGIIDTHVHVFHEAQLMRLSEGAAALWGANYLQSALRFGVTTVRDLGAQTPAVFGLKRALDAGYVVGPRLLAAGSGICMTGGHGWANLSVEADGPEGVRRVARLQLKAGADVIKLMASGGAGTPGELPTSVQLGEDEMRAAVIEAHDAGKPVATHALATQSIINAVKAGVDSIEHGVFLDDEGIELMLKHDVTLCPTISVYPRIVERGAQGGEAQFVIDKSVPLRAPHMASFGKAVKAGVRVVFGTDSATLYNPIGDFGAEMALMVEAGMKPLEVLRSATSAAAEICGIGQTTGSLEPGKIADLVVVKGDPTRAIAALGAVDRVYRAGREVFRRDQGYPNAGLTAGPVLRTDPGL